MRVCVCVWNQLNSKHECWSKLNWILGASDWSKACATIQSYKRRAAAAAEDDRQSESKSDGCNLFSGRWVNDNRSYPLYDELDCPYMSDQLACRKHGRPDRDYQSWRWQPDGCELKRYHNIISSTFFFYKVMFSSRKEAACCSSYLKERKEKKRTAKWMKELCGLERWIGGFLSCNFVIRWATVSIVNLSGHDRILIFEFRWIR